MSDLRWAIVNVGDFNEAREPVGWQLRHPNPSAPESPVEFLGGTLCGWTVAELHRIAHGEPCGCPVASAG